MTVYGDTREDAERNIRRSDAARAAYYKNISGNEWGDEAMYDLIIDSSLGVDESVSAILNYLSNSSKLNKE